MKNVNADIKDGFEYTFNDFYLTAFLICGYAKLEKIVLIDIEKQRCEFVLRTQIEIDSIVRDYFNDRLMVNPQKLKDKIIALKSLLHETKNRAKEKINTDAQEKTNV